MKLPKSYKVILLTDREPPLMEFVPMIDTAGEILFFRRTQYGYNMRDGAADNSPNNNLAFVAWLEADHSEIITFGEPMAGKELEILKEAISKISPSEPTLTGRL